jgi:hypothetical protein
VVGSKANIGDAGVEDIVVTVGMDRTAAGADFEAIVAEGKEGPAAGVEEDSAGHVADGVRAVRDPRWHMSTVYRAAVSKSSCLSSVGWDERRHSFRIPGAFVEEFDCEALPKLLGCPGLTVLICIASGQYVATKCKINLWPIQTVTCCLWLGIVFIVVNRLLYLEALVQADDINSVANMQE